MADACAVDQDVDSAEVLQHGFDCWHERLQLEHIQRENEMTFSTGAFGTNVFEDFLPTSGQDERSAAFGETISKRFTNS